MSADNKAQQEVIPAEILKRIDHEAGLLFPQWNVESHEGRSFHGYVAGARAEYLRHKAEGEPAAALLQWLDGELNFTGSVSQWNIRQKSDHGRKIRLTVLQTVKDKLQQLLKSKPAAEAAKEEDVIHFIAEQYGNAVAWPAMIQKLREYAASKSASK